MRKIGGDRTVVTGWGGGSDIEKRNENPRSSVELKKSNYIIPLFYGL